MKIMKKLKALFFKDDRPVSLDLSRVNRTSKIGQ